MKNFLTVLGILAGTFVVFLTITIVKVAMAPEVPHSAGYTAAQEKRDACVDENARTLIALVDKPWQTSEIVSAARRLCDDKGIRQPRW